VADRPLRLAQELDARVADVRGRLSGNDERILAFLREHLGELAFHTAESLAQGAGVSAAAVVRFSRRLGYRSFRDLRERARAELQGAQPRGPSEAGESTLARKVERDVASLELLPHLLDAALPAAAEVLVAAHTVWFVANRETYGLAVYGQRLMHQVRADARLVDPSFPDPLRGAGPADALVACTFRPYARQTLQVVAHARARAAGVVLVTDGRGHDFIATADVVLAVPVESPTLLLSFTPAVCVLEALVAEVALRDVDQTHAALEATADFVTAQDLVVEPAHVNRPPRTAADRRAAAGPGRRTR
jgi:DNA-binding MurR/RpiR family transcriptional regulator